MSFHQKLEWSSIIPTCHKRRHRTFANGCACFLPFRSKICISKKLSYTLNQLYISAMNLPKRSCLVLCLKFLLFYLKDSFLLTSSLFSNSLIRNCLFENINYNTQLFLELCLRSTCKMFLKCPTEPFRNILTCVYLSVSPTLETKI